MASTDIEKKSLEAHVEICAVRYTNLETKLANLEDRMDKFEQYLLDIKNAISTAAISSAARDAKSDTAKEESSGPYKIMIAVGTTLAGALIGGIFTLIVHVK